MNDSNENNTWEDLIAALETAVQHPDQSAWQVFRYLQKNYKSMGSQQVRILLAAYMKLPLECPSLIHSCMLAMAVKVSGEYEDFRFPQFLKMWGFPDLLRKEDTERQCKDGRSFPSLKERVERRLQSYALHHSEESLAVDGIRQMVAVKVFEKSVNGKRRFFVKLVAPDGSEMISDSHQFPCKPWEIQGGLYDVSVRVSKDGKERVDEVVLSTKKMEDTFPVACGYVEGVDEGHGHYHIYDPISRHFVAEKPKHMIKGGDFVAFSPVIPKEDKFKSAVVLRKLTYDEGLKTFGVYSAIVTFVNNADGYLRYRITSPISVTPEGTVTNEGFASLAAVTDEKLRSSLSVGDNIGLLLFLKRGSDGVKRNHVEKIIL